MRTCWEAGRVVISCTLAAVSERHNYVSLLEKMLKEVSHDQLLHYFSLAECGLGSTPLNFSCISSRPAKVFTTTRLIKCSDSFLAE